MRRALTTWSAGPRACSAAAHSSGAPAVPHVWGGARGVSTTSTGGGGPSSSPLPPPLGDVDRMRMVHDLGAIARKQFPAHPSVRRAALLVPFCHVHGARVSNSGNEAVTDGPDAAWWAPGTRRVAVTDAAPSGSTAGRPSVLFVLRGGADGLMPPEVWCVARVIECITSSTVRERTREQSPRVGACLVCWVLSLFEVHTHGLTRCSPPSFPGGRSEQQDAPPVVAAARQAAEELGVSHDVRSSFAVLTRACRLPRL